MSVKRKWKTWANQNIDDRRKLQDAVRQDHQRRRDADRGRHDLQLLRRRLQRDGVGHEPWRRPPGGLLALDHSATRLCDGGREHYAARGRTAIAQRLHDVHLSRTQQPAAMLFGDLLSSALRGPPALFWWLLSYLP